MSWTVFVSCAGRGRTWCPRRRQRPADRAQWRNELWRPAGTALPCSLVLRLSRQLVCYQGVVLTAAAGMREPQPQTGATVNIMWTDIYKQFGVIQHQVEIFTQVASTFQLV